MFHLIFHLQTIKIVGNKKLKHSEKNPVDRMEVKTLFIYQKKKIKYLGVTNLNKTCENPYEENCKTHLKDMEVYWKK